jgi:hypothetical protein
VRNVRWKCEYVRGLVRKFMYGKRLDGVLKIWAAGSRGQYAESRRSARFIQSSALPRPDTHTCKFVTDPLSSFKLRLCTGF